MKTTVTIYDTRLVESLLRLTGSKTKTAAVNAALSDWVRRKQREQFRRLKGRVNFELELEEIRRGDETDGTRVG